MSERSWRHPLLGIAGLAAWVVFILGCTGWPSWSPDGAKVIAPYSDPSAGQGGIALYDLKARSARVLFAQLAEEKSPIPAYAQWESDGRRAIIVAAIARDSLQVTLLPLDSGKPARQFVLRERSDDLPVLPLAQLGKVLYLGGKRLSALNLETGAQVDQPLEGREVYLSTDGTRLLYVLNLGAGDAEFGTVDPAGLGLRPLFKVTAAQLEARGFPDAEVYPMVAPQPGGSRLAVRVKGKTHDAVAILGPHGLETILKPDFGVPNARIGFPQWAPGGKLLYLPVAAQVGPGKGQYWVAEVSLAGGSARMTKIVSFNARKDWEDMFPLTLQVSLSPDGSTLATTTASLDEGFLTPETQRALYLVDLRDPGRAVTSIPAPLAAEPVAPGKEQE